MKKAWIVTVVLAVGLFFGSCRSDLINVKGPADMGIVQSAPVTVPEGYLTKGPTGEVDPEEAGGSIMETLQNTTRELMLERERNQQLEEKILIMETERKKNSQEVKRYRLLELKVVKLEEQNGKLTEDSSHKDLALKRFQEEVDECLAREKNLTKKYIELKIEKVRLEKKMIQEEIARLAREEGTE